MDRIIRYALNHKLVVLLGTALMALYGVYALSQISVGAVPDITNNQVQIITTSRSLSTEDVERYLTYPVELEMANLPGVQEIRSVSKFGLSVVTVVFDDDLGTYLPRQLIAEKIASAQEKIPQGFGTPFMGPITTGLGEIYQYTLSVDAAHKDQYSLTDLRSIQDWLVKRELSGIPGVVEVNTWGGYLKTYEIAIKPDRIQALGISVLDVFEALQSNNSIAGGSYIEKNDLAYFVRGEGLINQLSEIEELVVAQRGNIPVLVRDIAEVRYGYANRFGAITANGQGEAVMGQVMMLKGANAQEVIASVKQRVAEVQTMLPKGVSINPFLERSELIEKTTFTIAENLILGCLIVIFVVVVLLGSWRSGLVVASVIPLSLLFALSLMYLFGVDANLMSLGAIDFGIIIDGAVIIVEFIAYQITAQSVSLSSMSVLERRSAVDEITRKGASKMMRSAIFGQLIILIVFIPILSLVGVEGKMFRPMALVFSFALVGTMLLCFTYIPVITALVVKPDQALNSGWSVRVLGRLSRQVYYPTLVWALRHKKWVLSGAVALLVWAIVLFARMGGEFVPTLDEGDFVIQPVLPTGTSLSKTIEYTTQMEQIISSFEEVDQVVTRIGAAEVPTDPMSMEESDVIIKLHPIDTWKNATTKDGLADLIKDSLMQIEGLAYEFTQPIEMRFNELITGVRADVAIKIFGPDLSVLQQKALEIQSAIAHVPGASDISVEKIEGLPQMRVQYLRPALARYGVTVDELNNLLSMGFAGARVGTVFEGEQQYDMTLKWDASYRQDLQDIEKMSVQLPDGRQVLMGSLASVTYDQGPAKISRDDTKRRVVVGINVRNRDLATVVADVQKIVSEKIELPVGYSIEYGGQFKNLQTASRRLAIAVPVALLLIFVLLYFAFDSVKDALLIYTAIPLSAIGGVLLLSLRGMPFSISAGVGFIALFGIAVLNGIVLIEEFKELQVHGVRNRYARIIRGTQNRMRPVLLTASAAALGFLPMAISTSAGAEVQRPLATVVVGGLVSATLLTLLVLPLLYALFDRWNPSPIRLKKSGKKAVVLGVFIALGVGQLSAQERVSQKDWVALVRDNHPQIKAAQQGGQSAKSMIGTAWDIGSTEVYHQFDENNIAPNGLPLRVWGVNQTIPFPTLLFSRHQLLTQSAKTASLELQSLIWSWEKKALSAYQELVYRQQVVAHWKKLAIQLADWTQKNDRRLALGDITPLEHMTALAKARSVQQLLAQEVWQLEALVSKMSSWAQLPAGFAAADTTWTPIALDTTNLRSVARLKQVQLVDRARIEKNIAVQGYLPTLSGSVFQGTNQLLSGENYRGFQVGMSFPIWAKPQQSRIRAAKYRWSEAQWLAQDQNQQWVLARKKALGRYLQAKSALKSMSFGDRHLGEELSKNAAAAHRSGAIDFWQYALIQDQAIQTTIQYLQLQWQLDQAVLDLNYPDDVIETNTYEVNN